MTELGIRFEGPAVADGTIDVETLAKTMLALQDLMDAVNKDMNGENAPPIKLRVKSFHGEKEATE